ncbi:Fanconi anemia group B protein [Dunckerocampus dactyliophorus]|uniref:Fanconi anemia group B protein n=1 Tax=Dunckerocampus dactyliophorus TaxID=161453 RepID=UPI0024070541|nr:Fanconi anemia group B protein [Dunckerocampus dactyliophorus]
MLKQLIYSYFPNCKDSRLLTMRGATSTSNRLSFCGKIITFNYATTASDNKKSELTFRSFSFQQDVFVKADEGAFVISHKDASRVDSSLKCNYVVDVQRRTATPCVLVAKKNKKADVFLYSLFTVSGSNRLEPCIEFQLPHHLNGDVCILKGPTVLWTHADAVFHTSRADAGGVKRVALQLSHCLVGELPLHGGQAFILGQSPTKQTIGYLLETGRSFNGAMILPHPYISITKCIYVLSAHQAGDYTALHCTAVAATSNHQLLYLEDGMVKDTCQLPFQQPEDIQAVDTGRNGLIFVVSFCHGHVCAVRKDTLQVAAQWSEVSSVHVDDFLGCGTEQILLVFMDEGGQPLERFIITDLCGVSYSHGEQKEATAKTAAPPENHLLTIQALESRLQSGLSVLQELQGEVRVKERVVQQSVRALSDVVHHREPCLTQPEQEGLIALWESDDESKDEDLDDKTQVMPAVSCRPQVDKLWHRIVEDRLVVGVILAAQSSVPAVGTSLSVLTEASQSSPPAVIQTQSQVLWLPVLGPSPATSSTSTFPEPAAKRSKRHDASGPNDLNTARLAVTAVTRLPPLLNSGCVKCNVMLHYAPTQDDSLGLASVSTPPVLHCGQVTVDIHQDFKARLLKNPELKTDEAQEDLLCLLAVLDHWVFRVDSPDHSFGDIDDWLQRRVGCKRIEVSPQHRLLASQGPSAVSLLRWHHISPFQGELTIHSSHLQMLQLLDSLLGYLPVSSTIQPVKDARGEWPQQIFSVTLEKEVALLHEFVSLPQCAEQERDDERMTGPEETPETDSLEGLQRCRLAWQRDVERSRRTLNPLVDVSRYRMLIQKLSEVQLDGDLAALMETWRTLSP